MKNIQLNLVNLKLGSIGGKVSDLHTMLTALGYKISDDEMSQQLFGESTEQAVQSFQKGNQITLSGKVDNKTAAILIKKRQQKIAD